MPRPPISCAEDCSQWACAGIANGCEEYFEGWTVSKSWSEYPIGTIAPAITGGHWFKTEYGWKWNGPHGSGGTFPTPGGDARGTVILPGLPADEFNPPAHEQTR